jgi:hypothetical protein
MKVPLSDAAILARILRAVDAELVREPDGVCHFKGGRESGVLIRLSGPAGYFRARSGEDHSALPHPVSIGSASDVVGFKSPPSGATPYLMTAGADPQR